MDSYSSCSSSYSHSSNSETQFPSYYQQLEEKNTKPPPAFRSALHSVRKFPAKNVIMKKPIAPLPPTPPKIYNVDPVNFRDVVQKLTGASEFQPPRLQDVRPPPLSLSPPHQPLVKTSLSARFNEFMAELQEEKPQKLSDISHFGALSPLTFSLSPSSLAWCSSILLSP